MTKWLLIITLLITAVVFGLLYVEVHHEAAIQGGAASTTALAKNVISVVHSYKDGVHRYAGQLRLAHSCYTVTTDTQDEPANKLEHVNLTVIDNMARQGFCAQIVTRYPFSVIFDAPQDTAVELDVNGEVRPTKVYETEWQNPTGGGYLNPIEKTGF